ncbi:MAG TPA: ricin-type beta-trefoil lectin domain protein [Labilithrix sp.]|nr:ricin-type beta-trefoil lectin domain protein [Labilithrix sp.]
MSRRCPFSFVSALSFTLAAFPSLCGCATTSPPDDDTPLDGLEVTGSVMQPLGEDDDVIEKFCQLLGPGACTFQSFLGTAFSIFEWGSPSKLDEIEAKLDRIDQAILKMDAQIALVRRQNDAIANALVRQENQARLTALGVLRDRVRDGAVKLRHLRNSPNDVGLLADADSLTLRAAEGFLDGENDHVWRWTRDVSRLSSRIKLAFSIYEVALAQRAMFLTFAHSPLEVRTLYRAELARHATFLGYQLAPWIGINVGPFTLPNEILKSIDCFWVPEGQMGADGMRDYVITCRESLEEQRVSIRQRLRPGEVFGVVGSFQHQLRKSLGYDQVNALGLRVQKLALDGTLATPEQIGDFGLDFGSITHGSNVIYAPSDAPNLANVIVPASTIPMGPLDGRPAFVFHRDGTIQHIASGRCLDVEAFSTADRARVQLYDCHGGSNQKFYFQNGTLVSAHSGKCVTAHYPAPSSGPFGGLAVGMDGWLVQRTCDGSLAQRFSPPFTPRVQDIR